MVNDVEDGVPPPSRSPQLEQFLERWLAAVQPSLRPSTYRSYQDAVRLHISPQIGRVTLEKLTVDHVGALVRHKQAEQRLSPTTVRYILMVLRNALGKAVRWGVVGRNVATLVDAPRLQPRDVRVLSPDETKRLIEAARGDPMEALFVLAVSTGLRQGEALGLRWDRVDFERRQLRIDKSLQRIPGRGFVLADTKTRRGRRSILVPIITAEALRRHRSAQADLRRAAGREWTEGDFVFTSSTGRPLDARNVQRTFARILRKARLPQMRFHDLRHSCASLLLTQGVSPRVVMETLGHSRISVTMDTYTHVMPSLMRDAADAMDRSLSEDRSR